MFRVDQPKGFWRAMFLLCLALFGLAFVPESAIGAVADQTRYSVQRGSPVAIPNFVDVEAGCNWSGIGGQVFDQNGSPMMGLIVKVSGIFDGHQVLEYIYTGSSQRFGPGGYDLKLADRPVSSQSLSIQLLDTVGTPLSMPFGLYTFDTCQQNLLIINFAPISISHPVYLPRVSR
jgi:hypothetical protein